MKVGKFEFPPKLESLEIYLLAADNPIGKRQLRPIFRRKRNREVLTREQVVAIKRGRRVLRREMKERGLKRRIDFEVTATNLNLFFDRNRFLWPFFLWLIKDNTVAKILATTAVLTTMITVTEPVIEYITEYITEYVTEWLTEIITEPEYMIDWMEKDRFTISLSDEMFNKGFELSDTPDFEEPKEVLICLPAEDVPCITIADIPASIVHSPGGVGLDGKNHETYFSYTFYCRYIDKDATAAAEGGMADFDINQYATTYDWALKIANEGLDITGDSTQPTDGPATVDETAPTDETEPVDDGSLKVSDAVWVMVIQDERDIILRARWQRGTAAEPKWEVLPDDETIETRKVAYADWSLDHINDVLKQVTNSLAVKPKETLTVNNINKLETLFSSEAAIKDCLDAIESRFTKAGIKDLTQLMLKIDGWDEYYNQFTTKGDRGFYQVAAKPFKSVDTVVDGKRENVLPYIDQDGMKNMHKYTVVFWLEGNDPDCTNELMNGHIGMNFQIKGEAEDYMDEIVTATDPTSEAPEPTNAA